MMLEAPIYPIISAEEMIVLGNFTGSVQPNAPSSGINNSVNKPTSLNPKFVGVSYMIFLIPLSFIQVHFFFILNNNCFMQIISKTKFS